MLLQIANQAINQNIIKTHIEMKIDLSLLVMRWWKSGGKVVEKWWITFLPPKRSPYGYIYQIMAARVIHHL